MIVTKMNCDLLGDEHKRSPYHRVQIEIVHFFFWLAFELSSQVRVDFLEVWIVSTRYAEIVQPLWRGRTRRWSPYSRWRSCAGLPRASGSGGRGKGAEGRAGNRKGESRARRDAHEDDYGDEVKDSNILSRSACADGVKLKTKEMRPCAQTMRALSGSQWKWSVVYASCSATQS